MITADCFLGYDQIIQGYYPANTTIDRQLFGISL